MVSKSVMKRLNVQQGRPMMEGVEIVERGPWRAGNNRKDFFVESDDFTHDVRMVITGDFETPEQKMDYAVEIARRLNAYEGQP